MMPAGAINKIGRVTVYEDGFAISGFSFFDKDGAPLWKHGDTHTRDRAETVLLEENEVIVGVVAKLLPIYLSEGDLCFYTDF